MTTASRPAGGPDSASPFQPEINVDRKVLRDLRMHLEAIRDGAGPDVDILLDLNFNAKTEGYLKILRAIDDLDMFWIEIDSFSPEALGYIRRQSPHPVSSCETLLGLREFLPYFREQAMDVAIIDTPWNGVWQSMKIAAAAEAFEVNVAPHNFYGHLCSMMNAHFSAAVPNLRIMEIDIDRLAWDHELFTHVPDIQDGYLVIPDRPGWGTEPNEEGLRAHPPKSERRAVELWTERFVTPARHWTRPSPVAQQPLMQAGFLTSGLGSPTNMLRFGILIAASVLASSVASAGKQSVQIENVGGDRVDVLVAERLRRVLRHGAADIVEQRRRIGPIAADGPHRLRRRERALAADQPIADAALDPCRRDRPRIAARIPRARELTLPLPGGRPLPSRPISMFQPAISAGVAVRPMPYGLCAARRVCSANATSDERGDASLTHCALVTSPSAAMRQGQIALLW